MDVSTATAQSDDLDGFERLGEEAGTPPATAPRDASGSWSPAKRFGFRFLTSYFVLYLVPFPLASIPWLGGYLDQGVSWFWQHAAQLVASHLLGIEGEIFSGPTGSGDTTQEYLRLAMMLVIALVAALVWSAIDRRRLHDRRAAAWLEVSVRYGLGLIVVGYGFAKVIPTQFTPPSLGRLLQPLGDFSPMGLLWTFMGFSPAYTIFAGTGELLGGFLLFFRRTRMLGALVVAGVMANIVMMNFSYDVPVKLFSSHLLLAALGLLALDARRLFAFFLKNEPVPPAEERSLVARRWAKVTAWAAALLLVGNAVWGGLFQGWELYHSYGAGRERPALWGIHDVDRFTADGEELPPLLTDEARWRALVIDHALPTRWGDQEYPGWILVVHMDGIRKTHRIVLDDEARTITRVPDEQQSLEAAREAGVEITDVLRYERPEPDLLHLAGAWQGRELDILMRERDLSKLELPGRGFHWINELPYNR